MQDFLGTLIGKLIRLILTFRRGGGHALPGLVVERIFPNYVPRMIEKLPEGVVIITGTNGKTTTTKIVVQLLKAGGKRVLTNPTGSNLVRGLASSLAQHATIFGGLPYDIAILEVDEATARRLVETVNPRWVLGLNVSRDQLDRYGEVDTVAGYVGAAMAAATEGIVTNAGDPHLLKIAQKLQQDKQAAVHYFGAAPNLAEYFPSDYELAAVDKQSKRGKRPEAVDTELTGFKGQIVTYNIAGKTFESTLLLSGQHNFLNGAAALTPCRQLLPGVGPEELVTELAKVSLAFGRGEKYRLNNGAVIELVLVKNPASFTQALSSYGSDRAKLMIAINDNIADGRDVSWLWDVSFSPLHGRDVAVTSGTRGADMALRLSYEDIKVHSIEPNLPKALRILGDSPGRKVILCTYTAMLQLYGLLSKNGEKL